jgi:hypothetical protein
VHQLIERNLPLPSEDAPRHLYAWVYVLKRGMKRSNTETPGYKHKKGQSALIETISYEYFSLADLAWSLYIKYILVHCHRKEIRGGLSHRG